MKNIKTIFQKGLKILAIVGLFGLVLGYFLIPLAKVSAAEILLDTCVIHGASQDPSVHEIKGATFTFTGTCTPPAGTTRTNLDMKYDDTGSIRINGFTVQSDTDNSCSIKYFNNINVTNRINVGVSNAISITTINSSCGGTGATARFYFYGNSAPLTYTLTILKEGTGSGNVTGAGTYNAGAIATATATANNGSVFVNWRGDCDGGGTQSILMNRNKTCVATFNLSQQQLPTVTISANPSSIAYNGSSTLTWSSTNATSCSASGGANGWAGSKNLAGTFYTGALTNTTTYNITCTNGSGSANDSTTVTVIPQAQNPTVTITSNPSSIAYNGSSTLTWSSTNATSCSASGGANGWAGSKNLAGTFYTGALTNTTTYNITCTNGSGSANDSTIVSVSGNNQLPTVNIYATPSSVTYNASSTISWNSANATSCTASGGANGWYGYKNLSGTFYTGALTNTTTYNITCTNSYGSAYGVTTVNVNNNNSPVSVSISADRTNIAYNESTIIRWYPVNATSCSGSGGSNSWSGTRSIFSDIFYTGPLTYTTTYTIYCSNSSGGSDSRSVTVTVGSQTPINPISTLLAITTPATSITTSSAQLNGLIQNSSTIGYNDSTNAWFEWGTTTSLGNRTPTTSVGSLASVRHASFLTGLTSGRTYYFRVVAENSAWRNVGSTLSFVTNRGQIINPPVVVPQTSLVLISSSVDRNQPIIPTIDNSRPRPGDEINYTVNYQNVGNASITNLSLRITLPFEVDYISSNPNNPTVSSNTLIFNLGTLRANAQGIVTVKTRVRDNIPAGTNLNFPATLSYIDPAGAPQSVYANVSAQVWSEPVIVPEVSSNVFSFLGANVFGTGFLPMNLFGWLLLIVLILLLVLLARYLFGYNLPFVTTKKTTTTTTSTH